MIHELKLKTEFFEGIRSGKVTFQVRKNDRDYKIGDKLVFIEYDPVKIFEPQKLEVRITCISELMQKKGNVILGIKLLEEAKPKTSEYLLGEVFQKTCNIILRIENNIEHANNKHLELLPKLIKNISEFLPKNKEG
jgi:ASC-1-like (ASCH) protein